MLFIRKKIGFQFPYLVEAMGLQFIKTRKSKEEPIAQCHYLSFFVRPRWGRRFIELAFVINIRPHRGRMLLNNVIDLSPKHSADL